MNTALLLADAGVKVTLYEKRDVLGGRAFSWMDPQSGQRVDNCQHITMRCCTQLDRFFKRLGVQDQIFWEDRLNFLDIEGRNISLSNSWLPSPLHLVPSFLTFRALGFFDKVGIARAMSAMMRLKDDDPRQDEYSIAAWLKDQRQTPRAMARFWRIVLVSACNEELERISARIAFKVFRDGFLGGRDDWKMGIPTVPLSELYTAPSLRLLDSLGAKVHLNTRVSGVEVSDGRAVGIRLGDEHLARADAVVCAVPFDLVLKMIPEAAMGDDPYFRRLNMLEFSPITGVHLWFKGKLPAPRSLALLDRKVQWIFNHSRSGSGETYLSLVVSSSREFAKLPANEVINLCRADIQACIPGADISTFIRGRVIKEHKATFSPIAGQSVFRPDQRSPIPGLYLAGDWTDTGWPATMESAVLSGEMAVKRILEDIKKAE